MTSRTNLLASAVCRLAVVTLLVILSPLCWGQQAGEQELLEAAKNGLGGPIEAFLKKGVSPKAKDAQGRTALHLAAANAHQATIELLLRYGAEVNAVDNSGATAFDVAEAAGHSGLASFLKSKGGVRKLGAGASGARIIKPSLKFKTVQEFEKEIGEPAVLLDSPNVCFFAPKRREKQAQIVLSFLVEAYNALYQIVGTHTEYKMVVYAFPKGNRHGWGGTSESTIEYDDSGLDLERQAEWVQYRVPHISGYIEEMAHNFVRASKAQFGWEMIGWSIGAEVSQRVTPNPALTAEIRNAREEQQRTFAEYVRNGFVFPKELPANVCDRIHAWILYDRATRYGPSFWSDFFRQIRGQEKALRDADLVGGDQGRNARYQITIECFDRLPGTQFKATLKNCGISLTTDVRSLHPESPGWNRRLTE